MWEFAPIFPRPTRCAIPRSRLPHGFCQMVGTGRKMDLPFGASLVRRENEGRDDPVTRLPPVDPSTPQSQSKPPFHPPLAHLSHQCITLSLPVARRRRGPSLLPPEALATTGKLVSRQPIRNPQRHSTTPASLTAVLQILDPSECHRCYRSRNSAVWTAIRSIPANTPMCVF